MKQGEESAAVEKNQAQSRKRREDFFGHRKRFCEAPRMKYALMTCKNQEESLSFVGNDPTAGASPRPTSINGLLSSKEREYNI